MEVKWAFVARWAQRSADGGLDVRGIMDAVVPASPFPFVAEELVLVIRLEPLLGTDESGRHRLQVQLTDQDGKGIAWWPDDFDFPYGVPSYVTKIDLAGIEFEKPGMYEFTILIDEVLPPSTVSLHLR